MGGERAEMFAPEQDLLLGSADPGRVQRPDFGETIVGESGEIAARILRHAGVLKPFTASPLAQQIRDFIYDKNQRRHFVEAAGADLKRRRPSLEEDYDVVLVGAGVHAAGFLHTLRKGHPRLRVLILEKSSTVCSTFCKLGDSLVLNSPTFSSVGLNSNILQGHFVQLSDFDELDERPFPTAKHLYELATMVLFHSDATIAFDFDVCDIRRAGDGYQVSSPDRSVRARSVVVANGLGDPAMGTFASQCQGDKVIYGDDFIVARAAADAFAERIRGKRVAVIGAGDTANCVMEQLLPLVYPHQRYGFPEEAPFLPRSVHWVGQQARDVKEFFFENKQRYCHSGGVIEFFWDGETPFDLTVDVWRDARELVECIPERLVSVVPNGDALELTLSTRRLACDLLIDCTGRSNPLSATLLQRGYEFVHGDIVLHGGQWDEALEQFVVLPRALRERRLACKLSQERIYFLGSSGPLDELIDDEEARNGAFRFQEQRSSLTNSKWSLEHTLPRTVALAEKFVELSARQGA